MERKDYLSDLSIGVVRAIPQNINSLTAKEKKEYKQLLDELKGKNFIDAKLNNKLVDLALESSNVRY